MFSFLAYFLSQRTGSLVAANCSINLDAEYTELRDSVSATRTRGMAGNLVNSSVAALELFGSFCVVQVERGHILA
jgi:hypothetical protein